MAGEIDGGKEQSAGYYLATEYPLSTATLVKVESRERWKSEMDMVIG